MALSSLKPRKLHVNLTIREDLYGVAQGLAKAEGLSVSALVERYLASLARTEAPPSDDLGLDPGLAALRGVLKGGDHAGWSKQEARSAKHEARLRKGRE
jgi:hypothetical protein